MWFDFVIPHHAEFKSRTRPKGSRIPAGNWVENLCDFTGDGARGYLPQLMGQPSFPDHVADSTIGMDASLAKPEQSTRREVHPGYSRPRRGGAWNFPTLPTNSTDLDHRSSVWLPLLPLAGSFGIQAPTLRSDKNYIDLDPEVKDPYGLPVARMHFEWDENVLKMWEHLK